MNMIRLSDQINHSTITTNQSSAAAGGDDNDCMVREQDRFMPIANVIRIMRKILPPHAKISDDAKETIQECVSEYISFITGEANERCQREQRKTITAEDVLWAMSKLGFDDYIEPLTLYLHRYRDAEGDRTGSSSSSSAAAAASVSMRGDVVSAFMKRPAVDYGSVAAFTPVAFHHNGFFGYFKDGSSASTAAAAGGSGSNSQAAPVTDGEQHGQYK